MLFINHLVADFVFHILDLCIFIFSLKAHEVGEFRELFIVHVDKVMNIDDEWRKLRVRECAIHFLGYCVFSQQVHRIIFCKTIQMFEVKLKSIVSFNNQFLVKTFALNLVVLGGIDDCFLHVVIITIMNMSRFNFNCVSQSMEGLNILLVDVSHHGVWNNNIAQYLTVFDEINLVKSHEVIYNQDFVKSLDDAKAVGGAISLFISIHTYIILHISSLKFQIKIAFYRETKN